MRVTKLVYSLGETVPTVQFGNVKPEIAVEVLVDEQDSIPQVRNFLQKAVKQALDEFKHDVLGMDKPPAPQQANWGHPGPVQVSIPTPTSTQALPPVQPPQAAPNGGFEQVGIPQVDAATF